MIEKYSKKVLFVYSLALPRIRKRFCLEISSAFIFYARELNLVPKCKQMNKLYCGIIKIRVSMKKNQNKITCELKPKLGKLKTRIFSEYFSIFFFFLGYFISSIYIYICFECKFSQLFDRNCFDFVNLTAVVSKLLQLVTQFNMPY